MQPVVVKREGITQAKKRQKESNGELRAFSKNAERDNTKGSGQHAESTAKPSLGKADQEYRSADEKQWQEFRHARDLEADRRNVETQDCG